MLRQRILTVAAVLPLFLAALFFLPNLYWSLLLVFVLAVAGREWARLAGYGRLGQGLFPALLVASALCILLAERILDPDRAFIYSVAGKLAYGLAAVFWLAIVPPWLYNQWRSRDPILLGVVGWIVLIPFWHAMTWLQASPGRLLAAMGLVWTADIAAYFAGRAFGRRKLAPAISPGKTWEGVIGALAAVIVYGIVIAEIAPGYSGQLLAGLIWAALLMGVSVEGDLFESWMKRLAGLKDSGSLLPGHGGLLDRVDALCSTVPLAALYFAYPVLRG
jgi:phosphatidate cytidylyltransferase